MHRLMIISLKKYFTGLGVAYDATDLRKDPVKLNGKLRPGSAYVTGAVDIKRKRILFVGTGVVVYFDYSNPQNVTYNTLSTKGATEIQKGKAPGLEYIESADLFVAWSGEPSKGIKTTDIYTFSFSDNTWRKHQPASSNTVIPTRAAGPKDRVNGTFGRFRYVPSKQLFILVNAVDQNVYFYKPDFLNGQVPVDTTPPQPPQNLQAK